MSIKTKKMIGILAVAISIGNDELATAITGGIMQEFSMEITKSLCPLSPGEVPFVVAMLEQYAKALREQFPIAGEPADELKKIPCTVARIPIDRGNDK